MYDRYEEQQQVAKQTNKRRCVVAGNDSDQLHQSYDHMYRSIGNRDSAMNNIETTPLVTAEAVPSQQINYSQHIVESPSMFTSSSPHPTHSQFQSQPLQVFTQTSQPSPIYSQPTHHLPQQMFTSSNNGQFVSYQAPHPTLGRISPSTSNQTNTMDSPMLLGDLQILDDKKITDKIQEVLNAVQKNSTAIALLEKKFDAFVECMNKRATKEDHMMDMLEQVHKDFQISQQMAKEDEFASELTLPLTNAVDVEKLDKKLVTDDAFRVLMVKVFIQILQVISNNSIIRTFIFKITEEAFVSYRWRRR